MSAISLKSITGITSITTPAGVDNQLTLHTNNTTEAVKLDTAGNLHLHNHLNITGVSTASNFKTGTSNLHNTGLNVQDLDVDGHTNLDNVSIAGVTTTSGNIIIENAEPSIFFTDTNGNPDYKIFNDAGALKIYDTTYSATRLQIGPSNGEVTIQSNTNFPNGITMNPGTASVVNTIAQKIGDTDTKIRFPAVDTFTVETGGSERLRITNNGLKVGTTVDNNYAVIHAHSSGTAARLHLTNANTGTTSSDGAIIMIDSSSNMEILNKENTNLEFFTNNTERLRITSGNGDVGISSTSPRARLDVKDANTGHPVILRVSADNATPYALVVGNDEHNTDANRGLGMWVGGSKTHHIQARTSTTASENKLEIEAYETTIQTGSSMNQNFVFDSSGRLLMNGAGDTNAFSGGDDIIIGNSSSARSGITLVSESSNDGGLYFSKGTSSGSNHVMGQIVYQHDNNGGYLRLYTNAGEKMRILSNGNISVGSNGAAAEKFQVNSGSIAIVGMPSGGGYKIDTHPLVSYASFTGISGGSYAARLGSTGTSTVRSTQIYGGGSHIATFDGVNKRLGIDVTVPKSKLHIGAGTDIRIGGQYGGSSRFQLQVQYSSGYTGTHWQFRTDDGISWSFDGVLIVHGSGGSTYGSEVVNIKIVYSRESGATNSGDTWRNGTVDYNIETLEHGQVGLAPSSGDLTVTHDSSPGGATGYSLLKLGWSSSGQGVGVWSKLIGTLYWGAPGSGEVKIQDKDATTYINSNP